MQSSHVCSNCGQLVPAELEQCPCLAPTNDFSIPPMPLIKGYHVLSRLGRGGMGEVFLAEDQTLGRRVAVKLLAEKLLQDENARIRFEREARSMATVEHQHIIRIYAFGKLDEKTYLAMEYVEGEALDQRIRRLGTLSLEEALRILRQITEALEAAWEKQIVHRDIKPSNILVDKRNEIKVGDFGLAKPLEIPGKPVLTQTGLFVGTPGYASPEQILGMPVDFRTDIYSLGIVFYEMLAGRPPFAGQTPMAVVSQNLNSILPNIREKRNDLPQSVQALLEKMTQKESTMRHSSHADLIRDIDSIQTSKLLPSSGKWRFKNYYVWFPILAGLITIASFLLSVGRHPAPSVQRILPPDSHQVTFVGVANNPAITLDGKFVAYLSGNQLMVNEISGGKPLEIYQGDVDRLIWSPDGSQLLTDHQIIPRLGGTPRPISVEGEKPCWSPDRSEIASFRRAAKKIWFNNLKSGATRTISLRGAFTYLWDLDWCPNGRLLALTRDDSQNVNQIWTFGSDGSKQQLVLQNRLPIESPRWFSKGDAIYYFEKKDNTTSLLKLPIDTASGKSSASSQILITGLEASGPFSVSADGRRLVYTRQYSFTNLWGATLEATKNVGHFTIKEITKGTSYIDLPRISPDGKSIAFNIGLFPKSNLFTVPIEGGSPRQITFMDSYNSSVAWSPDGKQLAFGSSEGGRAKVWKVNVNGTNPHQFVHSDLSSEGGTGFITWAPGPNILYQRPGNRNYYSIDPVTETEKPIGEEEKGWMFEPRYSPDGKKLAVLWSRRKEEGSTGLWLIDLSSSSQKLLTAGSLWPIRWSSDGQWIYVLNSSESALQKISISNGAKKNLSDLPLIKKILAFSHVTNNIFGQIDLAPDEKTFVIWVPESHSDVWLVENFDPKFAVASN